MIYASGLSFNLARNPYYRSAFCYATNTSNLSGYVPPSYNKLRGPLLVKERIHVENLLEPIRNSWKHKGVTIVSDGCSDPQKRTLVNFMEVGPDNVVQIITDNAAVCKAASMLIELKFSSIYWTPCVVHTLNLALKNICAAKNTEKNSFAYDQCFWISQIADDATFIKNFIVAHSMRISMFNRFNSLKLLFVAQTRFASTIVMLKRFKSLKKGLQEMVISD